MANDQPSARSGWPTSLSGSSQREEPDRLWVTDITEYPTLGGEVYCAVVPSKVRILGQDARPVDFDRPSFDVLERASPSH